MVTLNLSGVLFWEKEVMHFNMAIIHQGHVSCIDKFHVKCLKLT